MDEVLVNKVANSGLITLDLEEYLPKEELIVFDLKPFLFMELILREKDFRENLKQADWNSFHGKHVAIICSADAIIPVWAYMLVTNYLQPVARSVFAGSKEEMQKFLLLQNISDMDISMFVDQRLVVKGCGDEAIGPAAYAAVTAKLRDQVKSIMYGEPCSTVPIYKKK